MSASWAYLRVSKLPVDIVDRDLEAVNRRKLGRTQLLVNRHRRATAEKTEYSSRSCRHFATANRTFPKLNPSPGRLRRPKVLIALAESLIRRPLLQMLNIGFLPPERGGKWRQSGGAVLCWRSPRAVEVSRGVSRRGHIRGARGPKTGRTIKLEIGRTTWLLKFHRTSGP